MIFTLGQAVMLIGATISMGNFIMAFDSKATFYQRIGRFLKGIVGLIPGIILMVTGGVIYLVEWIIYYISKKTVKHQAY